MIDAGTSGQRARRVAIGVLSTSALVVALTGCTAEADSGSLAESVDSLIDGELFENSAWTVLVSDLKTGETLYDHNSHAPQVPGSIVKSFTTSTAMSLLGPDQILTTPVYADGEIVDGALAGDLVLVGAGDFSFGLRDQPDGSLSYTDFDHNEANAGLPATLVDGDPLSAVTDLAKQVAASGIREVRGDVVIDNRLFEPETGWPDGRIDSVWLNENVIDVVATATSDGESPSLEVRPQVPGYEVENQATTVADGETELNLEEQAGGGYLLTGTIASDSDPAIRTVEIEDPPSFLRAAFRTALQGAGVVLADGAPANPDALLPAVGSYTGDPVAAWDSATLAERVKVVMKVSYNRGAELFGCLIAVESGSTDCTDGLGVINDHLIDAGLPKGSFLVYDPAGSDDYGRSSALAQVTMLRWIAEQPWGDAWRDSLPIGGVDGSLSSTGAGTPAEGKFQGKTGTRVVDYPAGEDLQLVGRGISGYATTDDGRELAFALIVNGVPIADLDALFAAVSAVGEVAVAIQQNG